MFAENRAHRPAVNVRETSSVSECNGLAFVQRDGCGNSLVFVFLEVRPGELAECVALPAENASFDCPLNEEFDFLQIRTGDSSYRT